MLTEKDIQSCETLINNGFSNVNTKTVKFLEKTEVKDYLDQRRSILEENHPMTYRSKLDLLYCIQRLIPNDPEKMIEFINSRTTQEVSLFIGLVLKSIQIANIMQGHNAAEKYVTASIKFDPTDLIKTLEEFKDKYK